MNLRDKLRGQSTPDPVESTIPALSKEPQAVEPAPFQAAAPDPVAEAPAKAKKPGASVLPKLDVNRRFLLLAGAAAGLTALMAVVYLNKAGSGLEAGGTQIEVIVAKGDIDEGTELTPDLLTTKKIPAAYLLSEEHYYTSTDDLDGRVATAAMLKGEPIYDVRTSEPNPKYGIAYLLKAGERAKSISVDSASGLAGLIKPGNEVDLVATIPDPEDNTRRISLPVLQKARVIAVGDRLLGQPSSDEGSGTDNGISASGTATLAVQSAKIALITLLEDLGNLKMVLRAAGDNTIINAPYSDAQIMALVSGRVPPKEVPKPAYVPPPQPREVVRVIHDNPPPPRPVHHEAPPAPRPHPKPAAAAPKPRPKPAAPVQHDVQVIQFGQ